jgi:hypothetical protein
MAGGVISTGNHPAALWPGIAEWWGNSYESWPAEWKDLVNDIRTSDKAYEEVYQDTGFSIAPVKAEGAGIAYDANVQGYGTRATNVTYALGYAVTMEELQDNQYVKVSMARAKANAFSQSQTKEIVVANVLNRPSVTVRHSFLRRTRYPMVVRLQINRLPTWICLKPLWKTC